MILIADSGSTKTDWCLIRKNGEEASFSTEGYNPCYMSPDEIIGSLKKNLPDGYNWNEVKKVYFYGAGCYDDKFPVMIQALQQIFVNAEINVAMDLSASARALLGDSPGFAAILGTGTNTCLYDGKKITLNIDSMGFILGDEGSGAYIGKRFLGDYIRGYMPPEVREMFLNNFELTPDEIIDQVYTKPLANRFCSGFCKFIRENQQKHPYFKQIVADSFRDFFRNIVCGYPYYEQYSFNFVGSVAYHFQDILSEITAEFHIKTGVILSCPMDGLKKYHTL